MIRSVTWPTWLFASYDKNLGYVNVITAFQGVQWFANLPFVLFASFALVSGALIFLTPETLGAKLPDTFEEASDIGLKKSIRKK